jgi:hypothetical protein
VCAPRLIPWADVVCRVRYQRYVSVQTKSTLSMRLSMFTLNTRLRSRGTSCHNTRALLLLEFGCIIDHW